jgi:hypothetical protein
MAGEPLPERMGATVIADGEGEVDRVIMKDHEGNGFSPFE